MAAQKVEHWRNSYLRQPRLQPVYYAGHEDVADMLRQTLEEETQMPRLTEIAENSINREAEDEGSEAEQEGEEE